MNSVYRQFGCRLSAFVQISGVGDAWRLWETQVLPGIFFYKFFIFGCVGSLLLHALFSGCGELALLSRCGVQASLQCFLIYNMGPALTPCRVDERT